jgi:hypothetical protein
MGWYHMRRMRNRGQQFLGILRLRIAKHLLGRAFLDDRAGLHHDHPVAEQPHHVEIVRDEEIAHAEPPLQLLQQVQHHRLHRDVERRRRLVQDDEIGVERDGARNADARLLPARKLVRKAVDQFDRQADQPRQFLATRPQCVTTR